tara:strand:+ start:199 stop:627 length:429 start_codon:yes stop_codon:yes gene_type:complete
MKKILIVNANYYKDISKNLIFAAKKKLKSEKLKIYLINVPGVLEIPITIRKFIKKFDGFLALGCVIKGETPHFDLINNVTFNAIMNLSIKFTKPIGNGIITTFNSKQAKRRSMISKKLSKPNKGYEAANAVISVLKNEPNKQ